MTFWDSIGSGRGEKVGFGSSGSERDLKKLPFGSQEMSGGVNMDGISLRTGAGSWPKRDSRVSRGGACIGRAGWASCWTARLMAAAAGWRGGMSGAGGGGISGAMGATGCWLQGGRSSSICTSPSGGGTCMGGNSGSFFLNRLRKPISHSRGLLAYKVFRNAYAVEKVWRQRAAQNFRNHCETARKARGIAAETFYRARTAGSAPGNAPQGLSCSPSRPEGWRSSTRQECCWEENMCLWPLHLRSSCSGPPALQRKRHLPLGDEQLFLQPEPVLLRVNNRKERVRGDEHQRPFLRQGVFRLVEEFVDEDVELVLRYRLPRLGELGQHQPELPLGELDVEPGQLAPGEAQQLLHIGQFRVLLRGADIMLRRVHDVERGLGRLRRSVEFLHHGKGLRKQPEKAKLLLLEAVHRPLRRGEHSLDGEDASLADRVEHLLGVLPPRQPERRRCGGAAQRG